MPNQAVFKAGSVLVSILVSLFLCDWALMLLGYPSDVSEQVAHPQNYEEIRDNLEFNYVFKTNSEGLRYREIPLEKSPNVRRVFVAGDSFTEGEGIADGRRFTDLLETDPRFSGAGFQFINGGLTSTGPMEYGKLFMEVGTKYQPDVLIICVYVNDLGDTPEDLPPDHFGKLPKRSGLTAFSHYLWPRIYTQARLINDRRRRTAATKTTDFVADISEHARQRNIPESTIEKWQAVLPPDLVDAVNQQRYRAAYLSGALFYPRFWPDCIDISSDKARKKWENMSTLLSQIIQHARARNIAAKLVFIPSPFHYDPRAHENSYPMVTTGAEVHRRWLTEETELQKRTKSLAAAENVPFLDLTPTFREAVESDPDLNFRRDEHWTPNGHQVAKQAIADWLLSQPEFDAVVH